MTKKRSLAGSEKKLTEPALFVEEEPDDVNVQKAPAQREKLERGASFLQDHNGLFFRFGKSHSHMDIYVTDKTAIRLMVEIRNHFERLELANE